MNIGRYEVQELIKEGGMGAVYLARDPAIERRVAIKLVKGELDATVRRRFAREARAAGGLSHPNIVTIHDFGEFETKPYLVMEYVEGMTLADVIRHRMPMTLDRKLRHMAELCSGLENAHRHDVVHRDIKPANLIIDAHGVLKILDFGIARVNDTTAAGVSAIAGTPGYMSPEQIHGAVPDHRSDMFAAGAVCYELLSYTSAFVRDEDTPASVMMRIMNADVVPIAELCHGLPPEIERIVHTALAKSPEARFPEMGVMKAAIENAARHLQNATGARAAHTVANAPAPVVAGPRPTQALDTVAGAQAAEPTVVPVPVSTGRTQPRSRRLIAAIAVVALGAGTVGAWWALRSVEPPPGLTTGAPTRSISEKSPSFEKNAPTPLALGEVVTGRLAPSNETGRRHYWVVDLPAGDFKLVVDARRTDDDESNIIATISWVDDDGATGDQIGNLNAIADRTRSIFRFSTAEPRRAVLQYDNQVAMCDYWLGIFATDDRVASPFFAKPPVIEPLTLGTPSKETLLEFRTPSRRYGYTALNLPAGDYRVTASFARADAVESNVGGQLHVLGADGREVHRSFLTVNKIGVSASESAKLSVAEAELLIIKRLVWFADQRTTILVEPWVDR